METRGNLNVKYLGLHSCRYTAALIKSPVMFYTCGSYIVQRNMATFDVLLEFQAHYNLISALVPKPRVDFTQLISVDYSGNIAIHNVDGTLVSCLNDQFDSIAPKSVRLAVANEQGSLLAVLSVFGNCYNGIIEVYSVEGARITKIQTLKGNYKQCEFINSSDLFVLRESVIEVPVLTKIKQRDVPIDPTKALEDFETESDDQEDSEELLDSMIRRSNRLVTYYACVFFKISEGKAGKFTSLDVYSRINSIRQNYKNIVAFTTIDRSIYVMEMPTLSVLHRLSIKGGGLFAMLIFEDNDIYFSPQSNYLCKFNTAQPPVQNTFDVQSDHSELLTVHTAETWIHKNNYLAWLEKEKVLVSLNEYGIFRGTFLQFPSPEIVDLKHEVVFKITCCGLDINLNKNHVAVGDFSGGVFIYDCITNKLLYDLEVPGSVRSLSWNDDLLYIGTIDGLMYTWAYGSGINLLYSLDSTIICMAWKNSVMAVGCTSGELWMFGLESQTFRKFLAHETQDNDDERFGSLGLYSEIWSVAWSPCGDFFATGSEDQTVRIWETATHALVTTLPKHKRAVTGVRWDTIRPIEINGAVIAEILISCSDDESLRVYNTSTWEILHVFHTNIIKEWHTITYAAIQKNGVHVACVTQNGFLFVMDLIDLSFRNILRIHNGSIEGFDWKDKMITCSSEGLACAISLID